MLYALTDLGLLKIQGTDAKKFLQGQLTCDVESITPSSSCMGAHCNPQGRVISLFYLFMFQESYYLLMQRSMVPIAIDALKKYAVFYKIELMDASLKTSAMGITDSDFFSEKISQKLGVVQIPSDKPRHILISEQEFIAAEQTNPQQLNDWKRFNIAERIPTIYPETSGKFLPHEINLEKLNAINFEKGCYTGQEIIARMHYRAKLKNHLYLASVSCDTFPVPGSDIYSFYGEGPKTCGIVVDAAQEAYNKYNILLMANEIDVQHNHLFLNKDKKVELIDIH